MIMKRGEASPAHLHGSLQGLDGLGRGLPVRGEHLDEPLAQLVQLLVAPPQLVAALRVLLGERPAQPPRLLPGLLAPLPLLLEPDARLPLPLPRLEGRPPPGLRRLPLSPGRILRPLQVRVQPLQSGESSSEDM